MKEEWEWREGINVGKRMEEEDRGNGSLGEFIKMGSKHGLQMRKLRMDRHKREISKSGIGGRIQLWRCSALKEEKRELRGCTGVSPFLAG